MAYSIVKCDNAALNDVTWLRDARSSFDVAAALTSALTPFWTIEREVDPSGELTIIVLPVGDTDALVQVSTFVCDDWRTRRSFRTCQRAVEAIIAAASPLCPPACQASRTSRTMRARSSVL